MSYYFCYSSALDTDSLNLWQKQHGYADFLLPSGVPAQALNYELVADFASRFWGGRVLGIKSSPQSKISGILFEIKKPSDWEIIRHKEGVMTGASIETDIEVEFISITGPQKAMAKAYTTHPSRVSAEGPLSRGFFEALERAYQKWNLDIMPLRKIT